MAEATAADKANKESRDRENRRGAFAEPMVTVPHMRRSYGYHDGRNYGPGDNIEIPRGLAITLGLTFSEATRPATDVLREAPPLPNAPEPEVDDKGALVGTMPSASQASVDAAARHDERVTEEIVRNVEGQGDGIRDALAHRLDPGETLAQPGTLSHALASGADEGDDNEDMIHGDSVFVSKGGKAGKGGASFGEQFSPGLDAEERNQGYIDLRNEARGGKAAGGKSAAKKGGGKRKGGAKKKKVARSASVPRRKPPASSARVA